MSVQRIQPSDSENLKRINRELFMRAAIERGHVPLWRARAKRHNKPTNNTLQRRRHFAFQAINSTCSAECRSAVIAAVPLEA